MSLESFYGGKQGVSPVVKARFKYVDTNDPAYQKAVNDGIADNVLKEQTMERCFADSSYEQVWYGQLAIIDTTNKRNPNNGKLFRRVLPREESEIQIDGGTLHGEYIGRIVGPSEGYPRVEIGSLGSMITRVKNSYTKAGDSEYIYPINEDGASQDDTYVEDINELNYKDNGGNIQKLLAKKDNGLVPGYDTETGEYQTGIKYSWVNVRNNIDGEDQETYVYLGFEVPYTIFDFNFSDIDWKENTLYTNFINENEFLDGRQPFYQKWNIGIPRGTKGNQVGFIRRVSFGDFINANSEKTEILYDYKDLYNSETGQFDIRDYQGDYPQFEEDNLSADSSILVYTFYMYDKDYDTDNKTKIVTCYLGKITDIQNIKLEDDGSFNIEYSSGNSETLNTLKWINKTEMFSSKENNVLDSFKITYNTGEEKNFSPLRFLESLQIVNNSDYTEKMLQARYTDETRPKDIPGFSLFHIDGIAIDEETKEIKYHTDPVNAILEPYMNQSKEEYRSFENPTFLNFIEDMFVGNDGHLYVLYSSSEYRYIGNADNEGEFYIQNIRYIHIEEDGAVWYKGGDLPDSIGTEEEDWSWWQDLGVVKQTVNGVRVASELNTSRHDAYRIAIGENPLDWDNLNIEQILDILNSSWIVNDKEKNPYMNGHIFIYQIGEADDLNAIPIEDRMGQIIFHKGDSYFYDFQGQSNGTSENRRGWKYAGSWSSSDASMQLKVKENGQEIPSDYAIHRKGFYFEVSPNKNSEMELVDVWR